MQSESGTAHSGTDADDDATTTVISPRADNASPSSTTHSTSQNRTQARVSRAYSAIGAGEFRRGLSASQSAPGGASPGLLAVPACNSSKNQQQLPVPHNEHSLDGSVSDGGFQSKRRSCRRRASAIGPHSASISSSTRWAFRGWPQEDRHASIPRQYPREWVSGSFLDELEANLTQSGERKGHDNDNGNDNGNDSASEAQLARQRARSRRLRRRHKRSMTLTATQVQDLARSAAAAVKVDTRPLRSDSIMSHLSDVVEASESRELSLMDAIELDFANEDGDNEQDTATSVSEAFSVFSDLDIHDGSNNNSSNNVSATPTSTPSKVERTLTKKKKSRPDVSLNVASNRRKKANSRIVRSASVIVNPTRNYDRPWLTGSVLAGKKGERNNGVHLGQAASSIEEQTLSPRTMTELEDAMVEQPDEVAKNVGGLESARTHFAMEKMDEKTTEKEQNSHVSVPEFCQSFEFLSKHHTTDMEQAQAQKHIVQQWIHAHKQLHHHKIDDDRDNHGDSGKDEHACWYTLSQMHQVLYARAFISSAPVVPDEQVETSEKQDAARIRQAQVWQGVLDTSRKTTEDASESVEQLLSSYCNEPVSASLVSPPSKRDSLLKQLQMALARRKECQAEHVKLLQSHQDWVNRDMAGAAQWRSEAENFLSNWNFTANFDEHNNDIADMNATVNSVSDKLEPLLAALVEKHQHTWQLMQEASDALQAQVQVVDAITACLEQSDSKNALSVVCTRTSMALREEVRRLAEWQGRVSADECKVKAELEADRALKHVASAALEWRDRLHKVAEKLLLADEELDRLVFELRPRRMLTAAQEATLQMVRDQIPAARSKRNDLAREYEWLICMLLQVSRRGVDECRLYVEQYFGREEAALEGVFSVESMTSRWWKQLRWSGLVQLRHLDHDYKYANSSSNVRRLQGRVPVGKVCDDESGINTDVEVVNRLFCGDMWLRKTDEKQMAQWPDALCRLVAQGQVPGLMPISALVLQPEDSQLFLQMPYAPLGNLDRWLDLVLTSNGDDTVPRIIQAFRGILIGLQVLHDRGLHHGRLCSANVLFDAHDHVLLSDYWLVNDSGSYCDMYAVGEILRGGWSRVEQAHVASIEPAVRQEMEALVECLLCDNPRDRPSVSDILQKSSVFQ
jgi:hypothetical protein